MEGGGVLSAAEGADRVAARARRAERRARRSPEVGEEAGVIQDEPEDDEDAAPTYTCENCGQHEFLVVHSFDDQATVRRSLPCSCGATDDAATVDFLLTRAWTWSGRLDAGHRVQYDDKGFESEREKIEEEILCQTCFEGAVPKDWLSEHLDEPERDETSDHVEGVAPVAITKLNSGGRIRIGAVASGLARPRTSIHGIVSPNHGSSKTGRDADGFVPKARNQSREPSVARPIAPR